MSITQDSLFRTILRILRVILCLGLLGFVLLGAYFLLPANVHYRVTETFIFSGPGMDTSVYLGVLIPEDGPYQRIENLEISWAGMYKKESLSYLDVLKLSGEKTGQENLEAKIEYDVRLGQGFISWSAPVERYQQVPAAGIESDSPSIMEQASHFSKGISKPDVYKIYSFTTDYLTYTQDSVGSADASALGAYEIGSCGCLGYARLMTALCRACDIPSQIVVGLIYPTQMYDVVSMASRSSVFPEPHAWVEFNSYGKWYLADPTWGARHSKLLQFNRSDARHLSYGELGKVISAAAMLEEWALANSNWVIGDEQCLRYVASSASDQVELTSSISIKMRWDGRWQNMLVVWAITTWLLCKYRYKIIGVSSPEIKK